MSKWLVNPVVSYFGDYFPKKTSIAKSIPKPMVHWFVTARLHLFAGIKKALSVLRKLASRPGSIEQEWSARIDQLRPQWLQEETAKIEGIARRVFAEEFAGTKEQLIQLQKELSEIRKT